jgi:putative peptidoglycan lipid II flippase
MNLIKTVATVGGWTLVYRISSFIRDIAQATYLGAGMFADAFSLSFKLANVLRKLFAEGAFNASFLPIFSNTLNDKGKKEAEKLGSQIFTWLVMIVSFLMLLLIIFFRPIIGAYAGGIDQTTEKFAHLVVIGRIDSTYIAASFFAALFGGVLNTLNRFAMPAAAQLVLNIGVIAALLIGALWFPSAAYTMAWSVFFAGIVQVGILWINVKRCGYHIGFDFSPVVDGVKTFFKKLISGAIGAGFWQLNIVIDFSILTLLPTGAVSYFYYTDHVSQFPIGILGIAFSTALLPPITKAIHRKDMLSAEKQMNLGLLFAFVFILPATVILTLLCQEVTGAIYGHGNFTPEHVAAAAPALAAFALGLPTYMAVKVLSTVFFANKDTRTPLVGGMISIVSNILFSILLVPLMKHTGVALATTASAWCNCIYLMISLKKLGSVKITKETKVEVFKQCIASLIMGVALYFIEPYFETIIASKWAVWSSIIVSIFVFFIIGKIFGIFKFFSEIKETA